jgi:hypothetical protein
MDHAVTVFDIFATIGVCLAVLAIPVGLYFILYIINPFRSGH